ncbi:hypothetical protein E1B28_010803 [Marasmius oreades]|uniref:Xylanolytic transcriptional activator regulatory domain-containing protein n=1 Tax=Marasmius oreades TaxID=181124 RepID=A0A9P7RSS3_9AGAR|nr:uncharacterized protein E1B28_010803 [Marasmius oreades]KAG7089094.1 hypothetical protein E1B28_010803 [Marasmius oreades]
MPGNKCSNCIAYSLECSYVEAAKKRSPPKAYVEGLENRLEKMESLLRQLMPAEDLNRELGPLQDLTTSNAATPNPQSSDATAMMDRAIDAIRRYDKTPPETKETLEAQREDLEHLMLADNLKKVTIAKLDYRFYGKSSGAMLVQTAIDLKESYTGNPADILPGLETRARPEFWHTNPWELSFTQKSQPSKYEFPDDDLLRELVELYFKHVNLFIALLHKPTFMRHLEDNLHHKDEGFGAVVLLVCANGSRYSNDPRVLLDGVDSWLSSGWKWFDQVQLIRKSILSPPALFDLQFYCLACQFLLGSSVPHACWTMVGMGIRLAQDIGAHRRTIHEKMTIEDELKKRAFWTMVLTDYTISAAYGRPCGIQDEEFDLDLPIECDDEYWDHPDPELAWRQPPGKPSTTAYFISLLKLARILALALRTIYSINKSKILLGFVGPQWEQRIVTELDSALNQWVDSVPEHLRWDPTRDNELFFNQSAALYTEYYFLQVLIHRPFIPSPKKPSPLSFPSLAICTNAARSCCHIAETQRQRNGRLWPFNIGAVFSSGIILLLNIWGGKRSGDPMKEMADVHKCMQALRSVESRWHAAGRLWDVLYELASVGELPLPQASSPLSNKRERDADEPIASKPPEESSSSQNLEHRAIAGSKRALKSSGTGPQPPQQQLFGLPMYSNELGRLPVHGQLNYTQPDINHDGQSPVDTGSYWFTHVGDIPSDGITGGGLSTTNTMGDINFPSGLPTLADAQFFDQLASMTWTSHPSRHQGGEQHLQHPSGFDPMIWSEAPPGFGTPDMTHMWSAV